MIKVASIPTALCLLLFSPLATFAQAPLDQNAAIDEGIRREAARLTLRDTLTAAADAGTRGDLANAAKLYDTAWELVLRIGTGVEAEAQQTRAGLATTRLELARAAQKRGSYREADEQIKDVLRVDPTNVSAR